MTSASSEDKAVAVDTSMRGREIQLLRLAGSPQQELNMAHLPGKRLVVQVSEGIIWAVLWDDSDQVPWEIRRYNLVHCTTIQWKAKA